MQNVPVPTILSLDVGDSRIGVAKASLQVSLAFPCEIVAHDDRVLEQLKLLWQREHAIAIVVGLPRNLQGEATEQTKKTEAFIDRLSKVYPGPIFTQDEAGTSQKATAELSSNKRPQHPNDAIAATYILEDFMQEPAYHDLLNKIR